MQQFRHKVCTARCNNNSIRTACEVDVGHVVGNALTIDANGGIVPLRAKHLPARQGLHGHFGHEVLGRLRHHHLHRRALFDHGTAQLSRFVGRDAA